MSSQERSKRDKLLRHLELEVSKGRITRKQMRDLVKADAERPLDSEMLCTFCEAIVHRVQAYSALLQAVIQIATDQHDPNSWRQREKEVDDLAVLMRTSLPLPQEQIDAVCDFLVELRTTSCQGPARLNDISHSTAHELANLVMDWAAQGGRSLGRLPIAAAPIRATFTRPTRPRCSTRVTWRACQDRVT